MLYLAARPSNSRGKSRTGLIGARNKDFEMMRLVSIVFYRVFASVYESVVMATKQQLSTTLGKCIFFRGK